MSNGLPAQPAGPGHRVAIALTAVALVIWAVGTFGAGWFAPALSAVLERIEVWTGFDVQRAKETDS